MSKICVYEENDKIVMKKIKGDLSKQRYSGFEDGNTQYGLDVISFQLDLWIQCILNINPRKLFCGY